MRPKEVLDCKMYEKNHTKVQMDGVKVIGSSNTITGNGNVVIGDRNMIMGSNVVVVGNSNTVVCNFSFVEGSGNRVSGTDNEIKGASNHYTKDRNKLVTKFSDEVMARIPNRTTKKREVPVEDQVQRKKLKPNEAPQVVQKNVAREGNVLYINFVPNPPVQFVPQQDLERNRKMINRNVRRYRKVESESESDSDLESDNSDSSDSDEEDIVVEVIDGPHNRGEDGFPEYDPAAFGDDRPKSRLKGLRVAGTDEPVKKDEKACIICFENKIKVAMIPCGHACMCISCTNRVSEQALRCPICKEDVKDALKLFMD
jgi:hypothetical protein